MIQHNEKKDLELEKLQLVMEQSTQLKEGSSNNDCFVHMSLK